MPEIARSRLEFPSREKMMGWALTRWRALMRYSTVYLYPYFYSVVSVSVDWLVLKCLAEVSVDVPPPPLQIVISLSLSSLCSHSQSSLFSLSSFSLASTEFLLSLLINYLSSEDKDFKYHSLCSQLMQL